jgi:predicted N-formylglutamate amidohydrolase
MTRRRVLITCEHGGNSIPAAYRRYFRGHEAALESHLGYDPGALALARDLARACRAPLVCSTTSRLLVELNRSPGHPRLYSEITRNLPADKKHALYTRHYLPYREDVEKRIIAALRAGGCVVHVSCHSFTPVLDGVARNADVGLLYDPSRSPESHLCMAWQAGLRSAMPGLVVRRNYPYRGTSDGLTKHLRRRYPASRYMGIEIEVNQKHTLGDARAWEKLREAIAASLRAALKSDA